MKTLTESVSPNRSPSNRLADWRLFATAGAATLAMGGAAEAAIIYGAANIDLKLPPGHNTNSAVGNFTVDGGNVQARLEQFFNPGRGSVTQASAAMAGGGLTFIIQSSANPALAKFAKGSAIGGAFHYFNGLVESAVRHSSGIGHDGFSFNKIGYAGFQLPASKGGGEGWMRVEVLDNNADGYPDEEKIIDYAYNDAGGVINAGQVPEPSALGLLALGSAGVLAWRRRMPVTGISKPQ